MQPDFFKHVNYWRRHAALNWISARFSLFKRTSLDDDKEVTTASNETTIAYKETNTSYNELTTTYNYYPPQIKMLPLHSMILIYI